MAAINDPTVDRAFEMGRPDDHRLPLAWFAFLLAISQDFVRQPSISGEGIGMLEMAELVAKHIRMLGGVAELIPTAGYPVVFGQIDTGAPRTLLVYGMYDVQPVVGEDWLVPPLFRRAGPPGGPGGGRARPRRRTHAG